MMNIERDHEMISDPMRWEREYLPLRRHTKIGPESGIILDLGTPPFKVWIGNMHSYLVDPKEFLSNVDTAIYYTVEAMLNDGWEVD